MELRTLYFEQPGKQHTEATLRIAAERARALGITQVVVSSSHGSTALLTGRLFADTGARVIAVSISAAYTPEGWVMTPSERAAVEAAGIPVVVGLLALSGGVDDAVSDSPPVKFIRQTYYTFGQGMKVAVEVSLMAADAGLLDMTKPAIAIAGTDQGADTAIVITPVYARNFPQLKIHEILAKPRAF